MFVLFLSLPSTPFAANLCVLREAYEVDIKSGSKERKVIIAA